MANYGKWILLCVVTYGIFQIAYLYLDRVYFASPLPTASISGTPVPTSQHLNPILAGVSGSSPSSGDVESTPVVSENNEEIIIPLETHSDDDTSSEESSSFLPSFGRFLLRLLWYFLSLISILVGGILLYALYSVDGKKTAEGILDDLARSQKGQKLGDALIFILFVLPWIWMVICIFQLVGAALGWFVGASLVGIGMASCWTVCSGWGCGLSWFGVCGVCCGSISLSSILVWKKKIDTMPSDE